MSFEVRPLGSALGAEVIGLDFAAPMTSTDVEALNDALLEHIVLVVREQQLTPRQYVAAMGVFGVPARQNHVAQLMADTPEIWVIDSRESKQRPDGTPILFGANCWHTDHLNLALPPKITALYAKQLPPSGGDTQFANAYHLYDRLDRETKDQLAGLKVVYGADRHLPIDAEERASFEQVAIHPIVRTHPETQRKSLYFHPLKAQYAEGMQPQASFDLLDSLLDKTLADDVLYQHSWRLGDLALIDNRACLHLALSDYDPNAGRVMHRMIIEGDRPV